MPPLQIGLIVCCALMMAAQPAHAASKTPAATAQQLIDADRQFAASGAGRNIADAIGAMLAPDAVSPTPQGNFAKGRPAVVAALKANPANATATAQWAPVRAGISADGQHGFTYGFMTIREVGKPDRRAKYLAYWIKGPEGWRVHAYKRGGSAAGSVSAAVRAPALPPVMIPVRPSLALRNRYAAGLVAREAAFSARAQKVGLRRAFVEFGSGDAMNVGGGAPDFVYGNVSIGAGQPDDVPSPVTWAADEGATVSSTGDLGVTFGYIRIANPPAGQPAAIPFFTVWRRARTSEPWLYVAE